MRSQLCKPVSHLLEIVVRQSSSKLLAESSDDLPVFSRLRRMGDCGSTLLRPSFHVDVSTLLLSVASAWKDKVGIVDSFVSNTSLVDHLGIFGNVIISEVIMSKDVNYLCLVEISFLILRDTNVTGSNS